MNESEHDQLNARLAEEPIFRVEAARPQSDDSWPTSAEGEVAKNSVPPSAHYCQWSAEPNDTFRASGPRKPHLDAGVYTVGADNAGLYLQKVRVVTDSLIELDDNAGKRVLSSMRMFWASKKEYSRRSILYKRGILLWGPAGSGKTAIISLLTRELMALDGLVILCTSPPGMVVEMLSRLRRVEPNRNLIVVLEDIDEIMNRFGEHELLALLDGESQIDNVVNVATTNYPERLGARIVNRPSRFDERILVDMPNDSARERYLRHVTREENISLDDIVRWVSDTKGFSVAHLRELVVAVFCLQQPYADVLLRLSKMQYQLSPLPELKRDSRGFQHPAKETS